MSQPASKRARTQPLRYEEEQASLHYQQQEEKEIQRAIQASLEYDIDDVSDEDLSPLEHDSEEEEEEKQEPTTTAEPQWREEATAIPPSQFTSSSGPQTSLTSPLDLFQLFLPKRLLGTIAANTTAYARSKGADSTWQTTAKELYRFIAVHIAMGITPLPSVHMYWSQLSRYETITNMFTRKRYMELLRYFHISHPSASSSSSSPLSKVEPLLNELQTSFPAFYLPGQVLVVDEAMVSFKGRSEMKQYIKDKPTKWGYKVWCIANSNYLLDFHVYQGKRRPGPIATPHKAVVSLTRRYQHRNHILYLDRGFTSPVLVDELLRKGIRCCGTVTANRKELPKELLSSASQLRDNEFVYRQRGELGMVVWKDRQPVYLLTTHTSPAETTTIERRNKDGTTIHRSVPKAVVDYNQHKCGVDTIDQLHSYYLIGRKSKKWWPRLVWWMIDMCIINAYSLYNQKQQVKISQLAFRQLLMQELVKQYPQDRARIGRPPLTPSPRTGEGHWPQRTDQELDCVRCSKEPNQRTRSRIQCELCQVHLCIDPCFKMYHTGN
jgi:Transposase IS4